MKKRITQTDVVETMLLNNQLVTTKTVYKQTNKLCKNPSQDNLHVLLRPLKKKYKVVGTWVTDKKGNRFKEWEIKTKKK
jgi:hypothetical protein